MNTTDAKTDIGAAAGAAEVIAAASGHAELVPIIQLAAALAKMTADAINELLVAYTSNDPQQLAAVMAKARAATDALMV